MRPHLTISIRLRLGLLALVGAALLAVAGQPFKAFAASWANGVEAPLPADAAANPLATLRSVSCGAAGSCSAVGSYQVSKAEVTRVKQRLTAGLAAITNAMHSPASVDKAVCTGHVSYGAKESQAGTLTAAPITAAEKSQTHAPDRAEGRTTTRSIIVFAGTRHRFAHAGKATITQRLTRAGRRLLRQAAREHLSLKLRVHLSFTFEDPVKVDAGGTILTKPPPPRRC